MFGEEVRKEVMASVSYMHLMKATWDRLSSYCLSSSPLVLLKCPELTVADQAMLIVGILFVT